MSGLTRMHTSISIREISRRKEGSSKKRFLLNIQISHSTIKKPPNSFVNLKIFSIIIHRKPKGNKCTIYFTFKKKRKSQNFNPSRQTKITYYYPPTTKNLLNPTNRLLKNSIKSPKRSARQAHRSTPRRTENRKENEAISDSPKLDLFPRGTTHSDAATDAEEQWRPTERGARRAERGGQRRIKGDDPRFVRIRISRYIIHRACTIVGRFINTNGVW